MWFVLSSRSTERGRRIQRSEEHTSELQSQSNLVCRLLLEKKKQLMTLHRPDSVVSWRTLLRGVPSFLWGRRFSSCFCSPCQLGRCSSYGYVCCLPRSILNA